MAGDQLDFCRPCQKTEDGNMFTFPKISEEFFSHRKRGWYTPKCLYKTCCKTATERDFRNLLQIEVIDMCNNFSWITGLGSILSASALEYYTYVDSDEQRTGKQVIFWHSRCLSALEANHVSSMSSLTCHQKLLMWYIRVTEISVWWIRKHSK